MAGGMARCMAHPMAKNEAIILSILVAESMDVRICHCYEEIANVLNGLRPLADIVAKYAHGANDQTSKREQMTGIYGYIVDDPKYGVVGDVSPWVRISIDDGTDVNVRVMTSCYLIADRYETEILINATRIGVEDEYNVYIFVTNMLDHDNALADALDATKIAKVLDIPSKWMAQFENTIAEMRKLALTDEGLWAGRVYSQPKK
jgi:hypothetical protein